MSLFFSTRAFFAECDEMIRYFDYQDVRSLYYCMLREAHRRCVTFDCDVRDYFQNELKLYGFTADSVMKFLMKTTYGFFSSGAICYDFPRFQYFASAIYSDSFFVEKSHNFHYIRTAVKTK